MGLALLRTADGAVTQDTQAYVDAARALAALNNASAAVQGAAHAMRIAAAQLAKAGLYAEHPPVTAVPEAASRAADAEEGVTDALDDPMWEHVLDRLREVARTYPTPRGSTMLVPDRDGPYVLDPGGRVLTPTRSELTDGRQRYSTLPSILPDVFGYPE